MKKYWHMALFSTEMFFLILSASHFLFSEIFAVTQNYYKFWWNSTYEYLYLVNWYLNGIANTNFQIWRFEKSNLKIWKFKFKNSNLKIQIWKFKFKNSNLKIWKFKFENSNMKIWKFENSNLKICRSLFVKPHISILVSINSGSYLDNGYYWWRFVTCPHLKS